MNTNEPKVDEGAFICPHCRAYAQMRWSAMGTSLLGGWSALMHKVAQCTHCERHSFWVHERVVSAAGPPARVYRMVYPAVIDAPLPPSDLPENCRAVYQEARAVLKHSPRASAALLRLCVEQLCIELGQRGDLNAMIANLVKQGLPTKVQQALDIVRVTGNGAIHPGQIEGDTESEARSLFQIVQLIVEYMITAPNKIQAAFNALPEGKREQIAKRDS